MTALVAVSQRVAVDPRHGERRDALDQQWTAFLAACGLTPVLLPNHDIAARTLMDALPLCGLLFTGGNNLAAYGGDAPERDRAEAAAFALARSRGLPVLGVCRGMQVILHTFGVPLQPVAGHVACHHPLSGEWARPAANSYHDLGAFEAGPLHVLARAPDGVVEAVRHPHEAIHGIMWHPERTGPFEDLGLFRRIFMEGTR